MTDIDWERLRVAAAEVVQRAYAPYSGLRVGAAGLVVDDHGGPRVVEGCNVENASYGLALCAECGLASALHASGGGRLVAISVVGGDGRHLTPCGRCRQVLWEVGGPELLVDGPGGPIRLSELLPGAFGAGDLPEPDDPGT